jgi:hypothetical protein
MALCNFTVPLLIQQGAAIRAGFASDATAFTCLQVLDGCDLIWLVVEAVSPVGGGTLAQAMGKSLFKTAVKSGVTGALSEAVAAQNTDKLVAEEAFRGIADAVVEAFIEWVGGLTVCSEPDISEELPLSVPDVPPEAITRNAAQDSQPTVAVEPVTVCLLVLKAIKILVAGTDFFWGVYDAATHDAYAEYTDPTAVKPYTVALTWGEYPRDLDAHCWTPDIGGSSHHVYYSNKGWLEGTPYCELDVDDTYSYGPERISIGTAFPGEYTYAVNQYSSDSTLSGSSARVDLYVQGHLSRTFTVPTGPANGRDWWHVFRLNGSTGAVTVLNTLEHDPPFPYGGLRAKQ